MYGNNFCYVIETELLGDLTHIYVRTYVVLLIMFHIQAKCTAFLCKFVNCEFILHRLIKHMLLLWLVYPQGMLS